MFGGYRRSKERRNRRYVWVTGAPRSDETVDMFHTGQRRSTERRNRGGVRWVGGKRDGCVRGSWGTQTQSERNGESGKDGWRVHAMQGTGQRFLRGERQRKGGMEEVGSNDVIVDVVCDL